VYLRDIWPSPAEIQDVVARCVTPDKFAEQYRNVFDGNAVWNDITAAASDTYPWNDASTYIHNPPFFHGMDKNVPPVAGVTGARVLVMLGDSVTTDHISPAGAIGPDSPAGRYLIERGVAPRDFNTYGSRRGNDMVMTRGTFANIRLRNLLAPGTEGGVTVHLPSGERMSVFDAAERYRRDGTPLVVLAGREYGTGSSRDWAAKGTGLLGVRAVIAESFERIHRSNLVGMGVLPLQFNHGDTRASLGITGREVFDIIGLADDMTPRARLNLRLTDPDTGAARTVPVTSRLDTPVEVDYYRNGGILHAVLRKLAADA
ncbi:MAG: aconitate hydratase, partial [Phycisphaerae bacterium]